MFKNDIIDCDNNVSIKGWIKSDLQYDHTVHNIKIYFCTVSVLRDSGVEDILPVYISEKLISQGIRKNTFVSIKGEIHSYNTKDESKSKLKLYVCAKNIILESLGDFENSIQLIGYVCKAPKYRITPLGKQITDVMLAVNRKYGRSDYIPCILWNNNAMLCGQWKVGTKVMLLGRMQSRLYSKMIDGVRETRIAYEVSVREWQLEDSRPIETNI